MDFIVAGIILLVAIVSVVGVVAHYSKKIGKLEGEVQLFKNANEYQQDSVVVFTPNYEVLFANKEGRKLLELSVHYEHKPVEKSLTIQSAKSEPKTISEVISSQEKATQGMIYLEKSLLTIGEKKHRVNVYIDSSKWNMENSIICVFQDANSEFKDEENRKKLGEIDFLTELPSQFKASFDINKLAIEAQKNSEKFALFIFDVYHFENMKLSEGNSYANNILKKFAHFLQNQEKDDITSYRLDGCNFLVIFNDFKSEKIVLDTAKEISQTVSNLFTKENKDLHIISSVGISLFPEHGRNASKLIDRAYLALEDAKEKGSGSVKIYTDKGDSGQQNDALMISEIKTALSNKEFFIHYQPIFDPKTMEATGAEAVLLWKHPRLGEMGLSKFLSVAEKSGQIIEIGDFILAEVVHQRKLWNEFNFKDIELVFEITDSQLKKSNFAEKLQKLLVDSKVSPHHINFNVSQSASLNKSNKPCSEFLQLKEMGIRLWVDNFGVGSTTVEQLHSMTIHTLKIHDSLLDDAMKKKEDQEILKAIIFLAHSLHMEVAAQNVKNKKEFDLLLSLGCNRTQGTFFSKPLVAFEFQELLRK